MECAKSVADSSGSGSGRGGGGGGGATTPNCDVNATAESLPIVVESAWISSTADESNESTVSAPGAAAAEANGKISPTPALNSEDDLQLPDPPNVAAVMEQPATEEVPNTGRQSPTSSSSRSPPPLQSSAAAAAAASRVMESAASQEKQPPPLDLIHQAAILSSVFEDDDAAADTNVADAAAASDIHVPSNLVFPSTSDAQPVTEPFDIQLLGQAAPFEAQHQDIVLSEHIAEITPSPEEEGAVTVEGSSGNQLLLTPDGTLVLSFDSNIVLLDHDHELSLQQLQPVQGEANPSESLSMPIVSTEGNGKTILWSSTAAPSDWPPKAGLKNL